MSADKKSADTFSSIDVELDISSASGASMQEALQSMQDVSLSPLRVALDFAQAQLKEATMLREQAEARAQEVSARR